MRRLRAAGTVMLGKTHVPELEALAVDRVARLRRDAQPVGPAPHARRVERRLGRRRRRRPRRRRARHRRRRLDPHPRRCCGLFGLKPQRDRVPMGDNWHGMSVTGALTRGVLDTRAVPRRGQGRRPVLRRGGAATARAAADRVLAGDAARRDRRGSSDEQRGARRAHGRAAARARPHGRGARSRLRQHRRERARRATSTGIQQRRRSGCRTPSGSRAGRAGSRASARRSPASLVRRAHAQEAADRERVERAVRRLRRRCSRRC